MTATPAPPATMLTADPDPDPTGDASGQVADEIEARTKTAEFPIGSPGEAGLAGFCASCWEDHGDVHRSLSMAYALAVERMAGGKVPAYACPLVEGVWHLDAGVTARVVMALQYRFAEKRS